MDRCLTNVSTSTLVLLPTARTITLRWLKYKLFSGLHLWRFVCVWVKYWRYCFKHIFRIIVSNIWPFYVKMLLKGKKMLRSSDHCMNKPMHLWRHLIWYTGKTFCIYFTSCHKSWDHVYVMYWQQNMSNKHLAINIILSMRVLFIKSVGCSCFRGRVLVYKSVLPLVINISMFTSMLPITWKSRG